MSPIQTSAARSDTIPPAPSTGIDSGRYIEVPQVNAPLSSARDRILCGMVAAGLVQQALCVFLDLSEDELFSDLRRLNLSTRSDRPLRRPGGAHPWSAEHVRLLITRWVANIHPESIGAELGRSAAGVRSKARRLGFYRRSRKDLIKVAVVTETLSEELRTAASAAVSASGAQASDAAASRQRRHARRIVWNDDLDMKVARRWFAWQCRHGIAKDLGLTEGQVRSRASRMGLPLRERHKIVADYVEGRPYDMSLEHSVVRRRCLEGKMFFYGPRNGPQTSPKIMKTKRYKELRSGLGEAWLHL
jgi:hypothetical protein